jgi:hypothetical protein
VGAVVNSIHTMDVVASRKVQIRTTFIVVPKANLPTGVPPKYKHYFLGEEELEKWVTLGGARIDSADVYIVDEQCPKNVLGGLRLGYADFIMSQAVTLTGRGEETGAAAIGAPPAGSSNAPGSNDAPSSSTAKHGAGQQQGAGPPAQQGA